MKLIKVHSLLTGLLLLFIGSVQSQNVFQKTYGGTAADFGEGIKATSDLGFILTGSTRSYGTVGAEARDFFTMKANLLGITTWTRELGITNNRQEGKVVNITSDGGYVVGGRTYELADGNDSWLLKKYSSVGAPVYENVFGKNSGTASGGFAWDDELWDLEETPVPYPPNHVTMLGFTQNYRDPDKKDMTFVIYNMAGAAISISRHIGTLATGTGIETGRDFVYETAAGAYTLFGESNAMVGGNGADFLAVKLTAVYGLGAYKSFGTTGTEEARTILKTSDGGYFMFGWTNGPGTAGGNDFLAVKTDVNFNVSWSNVIGGAGDELGIQAKQTSDGGYILIGQTTSFNTFSVGGTDMFVVKLTSGGALSWAKVYGGSGYDDGRNLDIRSDGGFFFSGSCSEPVSPPGNGQDIFLVAANSTGYSGGCNEASVTPTVNAVVLTSAAVGLSSTSNLIEMIAQPMTPTSTAPTLTCKCENFAPNKEIQGLTQVCHNTSGVYYINSIPGHTNYLWTLTGATFASAPGAADTSVTLNFTNTNAQLIVATNDANCSDFVIDTIDISIDNIATAITTPDSLLCVGQSTNLTAATINNQGAIASWVWTPAGPNAAVNNVAPGSTTLYSVTVTDAWGCTAGDQINVQVFNYPVVNIGPNDTVCNGGPVLLNATTVGATYLWSTSASTATINAVTSGTYWVDVTTSAATCTTRDSIILGISMSPAITITGDDSICIGQSTTLTANPSLGSMPYGYLWSGGLGTLPSITVSPIINTTYTVTVTEALGCTNTQTKLVNVFSYPVVNLGPDDTVCTGGPVLLDATTTGASYLWSTSATTPTINAASTSIYWVDVNTNGCVTRDSIQLNIGVTPISSILGLDTICFGDRDTLVASGIGGTLPYSYTWASGLGTNDSVVVTPLTTTSYFVNIEEVNGCSSNGSITVTVLNYPIVNLGPDTGVCNGAFPFVTLDAQNAGYTYTWSTAATSQTINVNTSGPYWVDVSNFGCSTRDSVVVTFSTSPTSAYTGVTSFCVGSGTMMYGNGSGGTSPYTYVWSSGPTTADSIYLSPATTTPYNVITFDLAGCSDTAYFTLTVNPYPVVNLGPDTTGCFNAPITLFAPATTGTTLWSTGAVTNSISVPTADTVWVQIDELGCATTDSIVVDYYPIPVVNLGPDTIMCSIQTLILDATNIFSTYLWSTSATTPTLSVSQTGNYSVDVVSCGVTYSDNIVVFMDTFSVYVVSMLPNDCGTSNGALTVGSTSAYPTTYLWTAGATGTNPALTNISDGNFTVDATDSLGCVVTATIPVPCVIPAIVITQLVTPNGDGKNDTWIIQNISNFPNAKVEVFNRWGNQVYISQPYANNWDGKSNSGMSLGNGYLPAGTYFYVVDVYGDGSDVRSGYLEFQP